MWFDYNAKSKPWERRLTITEEAAIEREKQKKEMIEREWEKFIREEDREPGRSF
uniref:Uncharacterized protein n=1 Tax=viral metagenome TaxID=1070528 RepID=A0A6M3LAT6_9ZZZZ